MRPALAKIVELYKTHPVFQDLIETAAGTALVAGGQAAMTDMTPEEIAIASTAAFGAGMIGRPVMGRAGQAIGGIVDRRAPNIGEALLEGIEDGTNILPGPMREIMDAKMNPYKHLGGAAQYGNLLGRAYGDNAAQVLVGLAAPGIFGGEENA